jgi:hypothetical protein
MRTADALAGLHADLERHRQVTLQDWRAEPDALLERRPSTGGWSAADCLEHIGRANDMYLRHMERAVERAEQQRRGPVDEYHPGALGRRICAALAPGARPQRGGPRRIRFKGPTLRGYDPLRDPEQIPVAATLQRYKAQLDRMLRLLERCEGIDLHARSNTLLGPLLRLRMGDMWAYLVAHTDRHLEQGRRALEMARDTG